MPTRLTENEEKLLVKMLLVALVQDNIDFQGLYEIEEEYLEKTSKMQHDIFEKTLDKLFSKGFIYLPCGGKINLHATGWKIARNMLVDTLFPHPSLRTDRIIS